MDIINAYIEYLTYTKRYSQHTVEAYRKDLIHFQKFLYEKFSGCQVQFANYQNIRTWVLFLVEEGLNTRSVNRKITSLRSFYKYLLQQEIVKVNPVAKVEALKTQKKLPSFVNEKQTNFLFDQFDFPSSFEGKRDHLIIKLFYFTGIRLSELLNMKEADINESLGYIKVLGKRNKERIIPVSTGFAAELRSYISLKRNFHESNYLFLTQSGERAYPKLIYRIVNKYLSVVSTQTKKSPHILRHTFATHMLNNGADLNAIKEVLGHANLSATEVYTHVSLEKLKSIYKHAHPRAKISED